MGIRYRLIPYFNELPEEVLLNIVQHLQGMTWRGTLASLMQVNKQMYRIGKPELYNVRRAKKSWIVLWALNRGLDETWSYALPGLLADNRRKPGCAASALVKACELSRRGAVKGMLDGGVDPNSSTTVTSALRAAVNGPDPEKAAWIVKKLLQKGADVHNADRTGWTALHCAARKGNPAVIERLLAAGADLHGKSQFDNTPIICAAANGQIKAIEVLINHGANVNDEDDEGRTPVIFAAVNAQVPTVQFLLSHGANKDSANDMGRTALSFAAEKGNVLVVKALVEAGCSINQRDAFSRVALDYCIPGYPWDEIKSIIEASPRRLPGLR